MNLTCKGNVKFIKLYQFGILKVDNLNILIGFPLKIKLLQIKVINSLT